MKTKYLVILATIAIVAISGLSAVSCEGTPKTQGLASGFQFVRPADWHLDHATGNLVITTKAEEPMVIHSIKAGEGSLTGLEVNLAGNEKETFTIPTTGITGNIGDGYTIDVEIGYLCLEEYEEEESAGTISGKLE